LQEAGAPPLRRADKVLLRFEAMSCPLLTILGRCSVYQIRPMVCRIWGAVASMRCEHGCRPAGGWMPEVDGQVLLLKAMKVGTDHRERQRLDRLITALRTVPQVSEAMAAWVTVKGHSGITERTQAQLLGELEATLLAAGAAAHNPTGNAGHRRR
jgi:Fe-S-cluster containining protein